MGKGRAPCCDKSQVKRGPWSPAEDLRLISFIQKHGHANWRALPKQAGLQRCGKSCRLRWINYLRPDVKRGNFTIEEEDTIIRLHATFGNKWSKIASHLPGRTDNEIKNVWNTHLKKRLTADGGGRGGGNMKSPLHADESKDSTITSSSSSSSSSSTLVSSGNTQLAKKPRLEPPVLTAEFSPMSSNITTNSNSVSQADVSVPEGDKNTGVLQLVPQTTMEEVNKPDMFDDMTFESDFDFWSMLELDLGCLQPNYHYQNLQMDHNVFGHNETLNQEEITENKQWLSYLANELGLQDEQEYQKPYMENMKGAASAAADGGQQLLFPAETYGMQMLLNPEVDQGNMGYNFLLWQS